jgi:hypothetical protein
MILSLMNYFIYYELILYIYMYTNYHTCFISMKTCNEFNYLLLGYYYECKVNEYAFKPCYNMTRFYGLNFSS